MSLFLPAISRRVLHVRILSFLWFIENCELIWAVKWSQFPAVVYQQAIKTVIALWGNNKDVISPRLLNNNGHFVNTAYCKKSYALHQGEFQCLI